MPELDGPPAPHALLYLWGWFIELSSARGGNGLGGLNPLSHAEIHAWSQLHRIELEPFEVGVLRRLDEALLRTHGGHRGSHQH